MKTMILPVPKLCDHAAHRPLLVQALTAGDGDRIVFAFLGLQSLEESMG
jgi:hypothetical protein